MGPYVVRQCRVMLGGNVHRSGLPQKTNKIERSPYTAPFEQNRSTARFWVPQPVDSKAPVPACMGHDRALRVGIDTVANQKFYGILQCGGC